MGKPTTQYDRGDQQGLQPISPYQPTLNYVLNTPLLLAGTHPLVEVIRQLLSVV